MNPFYIADDIRKARTLPAEFYQDPSIFELVKEKIFAKTWQHITPENNIKDPGQVFPFTFLERTLNEPLLFTRDKDNEIHCLSNVCTHRAKIVVEQAGKMPMLSCGYHGRCFHLDGQFKSMPAFKEADNFPSPQDHLPKIPFDKWMGQLFVSLDPAIDFKELIRPMQERLRWLPLDTLEYAPDFSKDYFTKANWALYCDNYLEGLHIPFVHPALNEALAFDAYTYELFPYGNLQLGVAKEGEVCYNIPEGEVDSGKNIYAYYYWVFPNMMFNFYPWGLSLNIVEPLSMQETKIRFLTFFYPDTPYDRAQTRIDETEMEDEAVVESVQLGVRSRFYNQGRFSPSMEQGVHHFHRLLADFLNRK